jgi:hypothetical protein
MKLLGIVDPFLKKRVKEGERFLLIVYPRQITSLRHVWSHPDFKEDNKSEVNSELSKSLSQAWLREWCESHDCPDYEIVMGAISGTLENKSESYGNAYNYEADYLTFYGYNAHTEVPREFWDHVEIVLGRQVAHRPEYFSCSC